MKTLFKIMSAQQWCMLLLAAVAAIFGYGEATPFLAAGIAITADNPAVYGSGAYPNRAGIFIPELWSGKILEKFYASTVFGMIANTDYEG